MTNCMFFGDSLTYGEYDGVSGGYVDTLKKYFHTKYNENFSEINVFNLGIGGETTYGLLERIQIEIDARKSSNNNLVFISYGANDLATMNKEQIVPQDVFISNLHLAISIAAKITKHIFLITILPISDSVDGIESPSGKLRTNRQIINYNRAILNLCELKDINYIDTHSIFFEEKEKLLSIDGVHPNNEGYRIIAEFIKPFIAKYL